ncbi:MAG: pyruvate formate lyase 1-activating protein, partial [Lachnospiraceae bacterium]|nr:pyruvate formate lyase 1-activating protein [Lachnospiraceae bacterium]
GITDVDEYLNRTADFIHSLRNVKRVDVLPYHTLGVHKWRELGIPYQLEDVDPPTTERLQHAKLVLGDEH